MLNEYNLTNAAMQALLPVAQAGIWTGSKSSRHNATIFFAKQDLPYAENLDEVTMLASIGEPAYTLGIYGEKSVFTFDPKLTDTTHVLGVFSDDSPAVVNVSLGTHGGGITYAGFHPGFSYFRPGLPIKPVDRTPSMKSLTNFVPTEFNLGARALAELALRAPATRGARPLIISNPLVEVGYVTRSSAGLWNGTVLPMIDWSATEGNGSGTGYTRVEVTLNISGLLPTDPNIVLPYTTATLASCGTNSHRRDFHFADTPIYPY